MEKPLQWTELSDDKKKEMQKHFQTMKKINEFANKANENLMVFIFGERMGKHYWEQYTLKFNRNIAHFLNYIDDENAAILFTNIFSHNDSVNKNPLYAHCHK